jgi:amino acid transporter
VSVLQRERTGRQHVVKRVLVGRRHPSSHLPHTLLPKILALPIFSSDPLSSVAYATEQIMVVLLAASAGSLHLVLPISFVIAGTLAIVVISYRQTVRAYPSGGGSYIVSKDNLGTLPALIAAAALLVDYVLTVSVSVVAGVVAIVGAASGLARFTVEISLLCVVLLTLANLRGVKETGALFAVPTYAFVVSIFAMLAVGLLRCVGGACPSAATQHVQGMSDLARTAAPVGLFVILHAFSSGSTALTGVEAISNGVPAFRRPQSENAATTLAAMGAMAIAMFLGISFLATHVNGVVPPGAGERSVIGQIAFAVFNGGFGFYAVQVFTAAILILAANTSYQDFPRLSSILAQDRYMPRQFANRGDRLVFSNGVVVLAVLAGLLIWLFGGNLDKLIQLYVVGVFTAFTLSQAGMVVHWKRVLARGAGDPRRVRTAIVINAVGAVCTGVVLVIIAATKFVEGAWISIVAMGILILAFQATHRHYAAVRAQLRVRAVSAGIPRNDVVLLLPSVGPETAEALAYVRSIHSPGFRAVSLRRPSEEFQRQWAALSGGTTRLETLPTGDLVRGVRSFITQCARAPEDFLTVVVPERVSGSSLARYVVDNRELVRLKASLLREPGIALADVPVTTAVGIDGVTNGHMDAAGHVDGANRRVVSPERTVGLVFVSGVHDASIRAVNYARSLHALETRAVYFALDHDKVEGVIDDWFERQPGIDLDIVDAPFRDLTGPMLDEVRHFTSQPNTVVSLVVPELIPRRPPHYLLHRQTALFVKRLFLFEPGVILTSVPYHLQ